MVWGCFANSETQRQRPIREHKETHKEENSCFKITKISYFNLMETGMT